MIDLDDLTPFDEPPQWAALPEDVFSEPCMSSMIDLLATDPDRLGVDAGIEYLVEIRRHRAWLAALEARAMVAVMGPQAVERTELLHHRDESRPPTRITMVDELREEVAAALHLSAPAVHDLADQARLMHGPMRATRDALADGRIGVEQARAVLRRAERMTGSAVALGQAPEVDSPADAAARRRFVRACDQLQQRVLPKAEASTPAQVGAMADRAVARIDAVGEEQRRQAAQRQVDVTIRPEANGLALLIARLDMLDAARLAAAIDARAHDEDLPAPCGATAGQRRVAALVDLACGGNHEVTAHIDVVVDLATLVGLQDGPAHVSGPGTAGGATVTAQALRGLLADPTVGVRLRRLITDPLTGALLDRGRRTYAVPDDLRAFIATRDGTCRFPGCRRRAVTCQMDHADPWDDGGSTDRINLGALCVRHHHLKTFGGWAIIDCRDSGHCTWRSPRGRVHESPRPPVAEPDPPPF